MAMKRGDLDAVVSHRLEDWIDLLRDQHKVTRNSRFATPGRLEVDRYCRAHRFRHLHPVFLDRFSARNAELIDPAIVLALVTHDLVDGRRIEIDLLGRGLRLRTP